MAMNDFQSAIDYLIANRGSAQRDIQQGMFTGNTTQTPTTNIAPKVVDELFGNEYKRRDNSSYLDTADPVVGSPAKSPFGPATANDVAAWSQREAAARANANAIATGAGFIGNIAGLGHLTGLLSVGAEYGIPAFFNYMGERSYDSFLADQAARASNVASGMSLGGVGTYSDKDGNLGTISTQDMIDAYDRETFGITGAEMNAARGRTDSWSGGMDSYEGSSIDAGDRGE
jgi:hypothetical protein